MADAMVTARIPRAKKEAGNRVLEKLGTNASQVINELYDYLLEHEALPFGKKKLGEHRYTEEELAAAREWVRNMPRIEGGGEDALWSKPEEEIRRRRLEYLEKKYGVA